MPLTPAEIAELWADMFNRWYISGPDDERRGCWWLDELGAPHLIPLAREQVRGLCDRITEEHTTDERDG